MRKSIVLAAAVAAAAASFGAQAQTANVTLYGRINTSLEFTKVEGGREVTQMINNLSRFGFKGTEKINSDLSAIFQIESGFNSEATGGTLAGRDTFVGLKGGFGTAMLGVITHPLYYATFDYISMHNHDTGTSSDALFGGNAGRAYGEVRNRNAFQYDSPSANGVVVSAYYALVNDTLADKVGTKDYTASLVVNYDNGPLHVGGGVTKARIVANKEDTAFALAGSYDLKAVVLAAGYERAKTEVPNPSNRNYFRFAAMVPIDKAELHANVGRAGKWSGTSDTQATQYTLGANYNLSKRTRLYTFYTKIDNKKNAAYHNFGSGTGADERSFALGLRHNF